MQKKKINLCDDCKKKDKCAFSVDGVTERVSKCSNKTK